MNDGALKEYRQEFALAILRRDGGVMSAGDVSEHLLSLAQGEGHPDECWRGADPIAMSGHLRTLEGRGLVRKSGERKEGRSGRAVPLWCVTDAVALDAAAPLPLPPGNDEPEPVFALRPPEPLDTSPYAALTRPQLYALLDVNDDVTSLCVRFLRDMQDVRHRARQILANAGIEVPQA